MSLNAGFDMACVVRETMQKHQCDFKEGALERILASEQFAALAEFVESEELNCPNKLLKEAA